MQFELNHMNIRLAWHGLVSLGPAQASLSINAQAEFKSLIRLSLDMVVVDQKVKWLIRGDLGPR